MKVKSALPVLLIVCSALLSSSCGGLSGKGPGGAIPGSGIIQSQTRTLAAFDAISLAYPADVVLRQGAQPSVEIQADDNLLLQLSTEVDSGRLTITNPETEWKKRVNPSAPVKITITTPGLEEIDFSATYGTLEANDWRAGTLRLILSGGAQMKLDGLQVDVLDGLLSGAGDIQVAGTADEVQLVLSGVGNFNAGSLQCTRAAVELSGMGDATVRVDSVLEAKITGAGSIQYYGQPRVEQDIKGAGSVKPAG